MRLFVAIRLSSQMQNALLDCMNDLKKQGVEGRYVPVENLHITLAFIGEYDNPKKVKQIIKQVPLDPFPILLSKTGHFGNLLWAGVQESQKLNAYAGKLRQALRQNGVPFDPKKFIPHINPNPELRRRKALSGASDKDRDDGFQGVADEVRIPKWRRGVHRTVSKKGGREGWRCMH